MIDLRTQALERFANALAAQKESIMVAAVTRALGTDKWLMQEVAARCHIVIHPDQREVFQMDGKDLVEFYPPTFGQDRDDDRSVISMTAKYFYRILTTASAAQASEAESRSR